MMCLHGYRALCRFPFFFFLSACLLIKPGRCPLLAASGSRFARADALGRNLGPMPSMHAGRLAGPMPWLLLCGPWGADISLVRCRLQLIVRGRCSANVLSVLGADAPPVPQAAACVSWRTFSFALFSSCSCARNTNWLALGRLLPARAFGSSRLGGQATALLWDDQQDGARPAAADAAQGLAPCKTCRQKGVPSLP